MSRTTVYGFPHSGPCKEIAEFRNAWGAAARVWSSLSEKYFGDKAYWLTSALKPDAGKTFWNLAKDSRLSRCEKVVFTMTFDNTIVEQEKCAELAGLIREFVAMYPTPGCIDHLPAIADLLDKPIWQYKGIGFYWTSVSEFPWQITEGEDDFRPYDISRDTKHWFLFEELAKEEAKTMNSTL